MLNHLTLLTDYETGEECLVDLSKAASIERLPAFVDDDPLIGTGQEEGARTKIVIGREIILVRESIPEIRNKAACHAP